MIDPGRYLGKVKQYGIGTTKAGDPNVTVIFGFKDNLNQERELTWFGSLKEGRAREITIDALLVCGFKGNDIGALAGGPETGLLDLNTDVDLVVENEEYNGKVSTKIKWINRAGGAAFKDKADPSLIQKMAGMNLKADVAARRAATGVKDSGDEIPF